MNAGQRKELLQRGYLVGAQIGKGTFGTVFQCTDVRTQITFAMKAMDLRTLRMRSEFQETRLMREVQVMKKLNHPFIVHLHDVILIEDALFLIMELIIGVDLFDTIVARGGFDEDGARFVFYQLCLALDYIHDQGILHRDVKPENILLRGPSMQPGVPVEMHGCIPAKTWIKLVDFGLSKLQGSGELNSFVGTPRYIAPEVITVGEEEKRRRSESSTVDPSSQILPTYSTPADCFSAGICLFVMLANCFPKFNQGMILFEGNNGRAASLSAEAKDLVLKLTDPDPSKRISMKQALQHPWLLPARDWVSRLVTTDTSLVLSRSPSNVRRSLKRAMIKTGPNTQSLFGPNGAPSWVDSPTSTTVPSSSSVGEFQFANFGGTNPMPMLSSSSSTSQLLLNHPSKSTTNTSLSVPSSEPSFSTLPVHAPVLVSEMEREWRNASLMSPALCNRPDVRNSIRGISNVFLQSERVVLGCAQTGRNVLDSIPDIRLIIASGPLGANLESIKMMLTTIRTWIDSLKISVSEILQLSHQTLLMMGALIQGIVSSPDVIAESIATMSVSSTQNSPGFDTAGSPLNRCIHHFERIEGLLRHLESFWGRMDAALSVLQQRAAIIATLAESVSRTPAMEDRFLQKLDEYFFLWHSAALLSQQFMTAPGAAVNNQPSSSEGFIQQQQQQQQQQAQAQQQFFHSQQYGQSNPNAGFEHLHHLHHLHSQQQQPGGLHPSSTVVVTNETSPIGSVESYEGDI